LPLVVIDAPQDTFHVIKIDVEQRLAFGWASVAVRKDGETVVDSQQDIITPAELEQAAYEFVLKFREATEMHQGPTIGSLVESMVVTPEKLSALGLPQDALPLGWWVGFRLEPETFAKVKDGTLRMFSIEGTAERIPV